jgi:hypothetical protein
MRTAEIEAGWLSRYSEAKDWIVRGGNPARGKGLHLLQCLRTCTGFRPVSYSMLTTVFSPGWKRVKRPGREVDHSPPSSTKVKNECSDMSIHPAYLQG